MKHICQKHRLIYADRCELCEKERQKEYDVKKRDPNSAKIYKSHRWKKVRNLIMRRDGGLCQQCKRDGRITLASVVDHIEELKDGGDPYALENLEALCHSCHTRKTAAKREGRV